jgi:hypothetical protein
MTTAGYRNRYFVWVQDRKSRLSVRSETASRRQQKVQFLDRQIQANGFHFFSNPVTPETIVPNLSAIPDFDSQFPSQSPGLFLSRLRRLRRLLSASGFFLCNPLPASRLVPPLAPVLFCILSDLICAKPVFVIKPLFFRQFLAFYAPTVNPVEYETGKNNDRHEYDVLHRPVVYPIAEGHQRAPSDTVKAK